EISENNGEFHQEIQYDGFTKKLQAELKLIPCETYHIRLVIADVGDFFYDSAVFLEAESFEIGGDVVISAGTDDGTDEVFEGCSGGYFTFERTDLSNLNHRIQVDFLVAEESTAIPGEDFAMLPSSIVIPSGEESVRLPIEGILDDLREPPESIMLELDYPCSCDTDTARLFLVDPPPFAVEVEDLNLCRESRENLVPEIGGGVADFSYRWNTGDSSRAVSVSGGDAGTYYLTVTDACGQEAFASAQVNTVAAPSGTISGSAMICEGDTAHFEVLLDGQAPWSFDHYVNGNFVRRVENITGSAYQLAVGRGGIHRMSGLTDKYCPGSSSGYAEVDLTEIDIRFETEQISCHGGSDGQVSAFPSGGIPPYSFVWEGGLGEADVLEDIAAGIYTLRVTDAQGCEKLAEVEVGQAEPLTGIRFDCTDLASGNLDLTAGGGRPPYQYSIDGAPFRDETVLRRLEAGKTYQITIRDQADCRLQQAFTMPAASAKMVDIPSQVELDLGEKYQLQPELYIPVSLLREISWQPSDQLSCSDCLRPVITAHYTQGYTLHVTDAFGCTDASSLMVEVRKKPTLFIPNAFSPNGDGINDFFFPNLRDEQVSRVLSFRIYNRWGNLVFEALDFDPGHSAGRWDGRLNGSLLNTGVFVYRIELELVNGTFAEYSGDVALIR
ncbi:MAG: gliding motility-associated C-terminal domain-containing protein, partial [Saprospiraceae bacterium]|nr:gliding motility-associated C-terminal domain-containing protein [Saprospiraceae bacterium]